MSNLTELAIKAKNGDSFAKDDIFRYFMPIIQRQSEQLAGKINNEVNFEYDCYYHIEKAIEKYDPAKGMSFLSFAWRQIKNRVKHHTVYKSHKARSLKKVSYDQITSVSDDDDDRHTCGYQFQDELSNFEPYVIGEYAAIDLIDKYGTNERRRYILEQWKENGSRLSNHELARQMVDKFGLTWEAQERYIRRFKDQLRKQIPIEGLYNIDVNDTTQVTMVS